jgi:hypothetical protein
MRLSQMSLLVPTVAAWALAQGCATSPKVAALNLRVASGGRCQALNKSFSCNDVVGVLTEAGISKGAAIQVQFVPGATVREVITVINTLNSAGFTEVSKTAGSSVPNS